MLEKTVYTIRDRSADSNNITGKTDSFFLSAFLIELESYQIHQSR
jgi:hypothetical protein